MWEIPSETQTLPRSYGYFWSISEPSAFFRVIIVWTSVIAEALHQGIDAEGKGNHLDCELPAEMAAARSAQQQRVQLCGKRGVSKFRGRPVGC